MRLTRRGLIATAAATGLAGPVFAQTSRPRLALLIGNQAYTSEVGALRNTHSDATLIEHALIRAGLAPNTIAKHLDLPRAGITREIRAFQQRVAAAGPQAISFFYYAGHGAAGAGKNYLIPVDVADAASPALWDDSVEVATLLDGLGQVSNATHVVAIDACRNELRVPVRALGDRGFAAVRAETATDISMHIAFSTWEGATASDGSAVEGNGPYARALAAKLTDETLNIRDLFEEVRYDVMDQTDHRQEPMNINRLARRDGRLAFVASTSAGVCRNTADLAAGRPPGRNCHALVIGNDSYPDAQLRGPRGDAEAVATAVSRAGFLTNTILDADRAQMTAAIETMRQRLGQDNADALGLVYYAGHGITVRGTNYLVPAGAFPDSLEAFADYGVNLDDLVRTLAQSNPRGIILLLDPRRTPMQRLLRSTRPGQKSVPLGFTAGFAEISNDTSVIVCLSNQAGSVGVDDADGRSVFARALVSELAEPRRRSVLETLSAVGARVAEQTRLMQRPWYQEHNAQQSQLYFRDGTNLDTATC